MVMFFSAEPHETAMFNLGKSIDIVETHFIISSNINDVRKVLEYCIKNSILIIGSIISANAYGYPVVSPVTKNPRAPPAERVCLSKKFNSTKPKWR